jgi:hypothetical protein
VVPHQEDANPQVRSAGEMPEGRGLGATIVCSGETLRWLGLIAGTIRATVAGRRVTTPDETPADDNQSINETEGVML